LLTLFQPTEKMRSYWIHGWATDSAVFDRLIGSLPPGLKEKAVAVDLPGFGPVPSASGESDYFSCLAAQVTREKGEAEGAVLVGWSMGAMAALETAAGLGTVISGLVLISACAKFSRSEDNPHGMDRHIIRRMMHKLKEAPEKVLRDFHYRMFSRTTPHRLESFQDELYPRYLNQHAGALERGLRYLESTDLRRRLRSVHCPVLVIHAISDPIIDIRLARKLSESLSGSQLVVLEDGDHIPFWGAEKRFASLIGDFLYGGISPA